MTLTLLDEFCGLGGSTAGAAAVPGVEPVFAANHNVQAVESHAANHPEADHWLGDVQKVNVADHFPRADLFWSSPACPDWSDSKGVKRTFDKANQLALWSEDPTEDELKAMRSRALMEEVVIYLRACHDRGAPVLGGVVENVVQCRLWSEWDRWIGEIRALGYDTRVIAFNSMHAAPAATPRAPQSRDRLYVAYWRTSLGRAPDWDKWLRPTAWCPRCERRVAAMQVFKNPRADMGRYQSQYVYRCPSTTCRNRLVEPEVLPASAAIDWGLPGTPVGIEGERLEPATIARIRAGMEAYWTPSTRPRPGETMAPLVVPMEGRDGKRAASADEPMRTQTCRRETALALAPFLTPLRGGGDRERAYPADRHLHTVTAGGFHHGLATAPREAPAEPEPLLMPYYSTGTVRPASRPVGTVSTRDRWALVAPAERIAIEDVLFRMLEPHEIQAAMAFAPGYRVLPSAKRDKVRLLGNAVTPPVAELLIAALAEAITGESL